MSWTPNETLSEDADNGTMVENVEALAEAVIGHRIVDVQRDGLPDSRFLSSEGAMITLDNGRRVLLRNTDDCCAYTELETFLLNAQAVDHIITGVRTEDGYSTWSIYADMGDVLKLSVGWSAGNPFYYGYGFHIEVVDVVDDSETAGWE